MSADPKYEMETRTCAGGCGRKFKTLTTSPTVYARSDCEQVCQKKPPSADQIRSMKLTGHYASRRLASVKDDTQAKVWTMCVKEAKMCVARMQLERIKIADLALKACTIPKKGAERATAHAKGLYTLTRFAEDIGVKPATLRQWVRVKQTVVDKVAKGRPFKEQDYHAAQRTMDVLKASGLKDEAKVKAQFVKEQKDIAQGRTVDHSLRRFIALAQFLERRALELKPTKGQCGELQQFAEALQAALQAVKRAQKKC